MQRLLCGVGVIMEACSGGVIVYDHMQFKLSRRGNGLSDDSYYTIWIMMITLMMTTMTKTTMEMMIVSGNAQGAVSIRKTVFPGMAIPMLKIRRPNGRLIFNMEIAIRR